MSLLAASLLGLSTHAYLGSFSRFIADDYCSAAEEIKLGIFRSAWYWYITWNGRYSANLLDAIFGKLGSNFSPVVTSLVLITWFSITGAATFVFLPMRVNGKRYLASVTIGSTLLFLTLTLTPNVQQSLYWGQGMRSIVPPLILGAIYLFSVQWAQQRNLSSRSFIVWLS